MYSIKNSGAKGSIVKFEFEEIEAEWGGDHGNFEHRVYEAQLKKKASCVSLGCEQGKETCLAR
jgi:hypothetical protein